MPITLETIGFYKLKNLGVDVEEQFEKLLYHPNHELVVHYILQDSTKSLLNRLYTSDRIVYGDMTPYIISLNNDIIFDMMDNNTLMIFIEYSICKNDPISFGKFFKRLTYYFYEIFDMIINRRNSISFMKIAALSNKEQYEKLINSEKHYYGLQFDELFCDLKMSDMSTTYKHLDKLNRRKDTLIYMLLSGAKSFDYDIRRYVIDKIGPQLHKMMCKHYRHLGYKYSKSAAKEKDIVKKLYKDDLIFNKIMSYVV